LFGLTEIIIIPRRLGKMSLQIKRSLCSRTLHSSSLCCFHHSCTAQHQQQQHL